MSQLFTLGGQSIGVSASTSVPSLTPWEMPPDFFEIRAQRASQVTLVVKKLPANAGERSITKKMKILFYHFSSVPQLCPTLCDPMDCSTPDFPVHHQLLELAQTHVHRVCDAIGRFG